MNKLNEEIGLEYLRAMHLTDFTQYTAHKVSDLKKYRHRNIGHGYLGITTFQHILADSVTQEMPLILETPTHKHPEEVTGMEIRLLEAIASGVVDPEEIQTYVDDLDTAIEKAQLKNKSEKKWSHKNCGTG